MKKMFVLSLLLFLVLISFAAARVDDDCHLNVSLIDQDPYPALPDDYVELVFQINGVSKSICEGAWVKLIPEYPFFLDSDDGLRTLEDSTYDRDMNNWVIKYKLRVDKDAVEGENELELQYSPGQWDSYDTYLEKSFNITIEDSRTEFDAVIQDISSSDISIAITNAGKYTANSVVVRIPEQEGFSVVGTDGQMVGNLDSGDYTIVGFTISQTGRPSIDQKAALEFDIYYTDNIGERRITKMELPLELGSFGSNNTTMTPYGERGDFNGDFPSRSKASWSGWYTVVIIVVILFILWIIYRRSRFLRRLRRKTRRALKKGKTIDGEIPDWIKNVKDKEKIK
jgi:hypothetical protein